jgi:DHA3 family tetracycline resistance protein-like MFS transporter
LSLHPSGRDTLLPGHALPTVPLYLAQGFCRGLAISIALTVYGLYVVRDVGLNPLQLVLLGTGLEAAVIVSEVPTGIVADAYSRRFSILIGFLITALGWALMAVRPVFAFALVGQIVWGLGSTFGSGAREAWLADEIGERAAAPLYMRERQFWLAGHMIGIPLSVALGSVSLRLAIAAGAGLHLLVALGLLFGMAERHWRPAPREDRRAAHHMLGTLRTGVRAVRGSPVLLGILAIAIFFGASSEALDRLWPLHLVDDFDFPTVAGLDQVRWFGVIQAGSVGGAILATWLAARFTRLGSAVSIARSLIVLTFALMAFTVLFALSGAFWLALLAFWATDWVREAANPLRTAWVNRGLDPGSRATVLSLFGQADSFGQVAGGPALGVVATIRGVRAALVGVAVVLVPTLPLYRILARREGRLALDLPDEPEV